MSLTRLYLMGIMMAKVALMQQTATIMAHPSDNSLPLAAL
jgi:hypothetical protein